MSNMLVRAGLVALGLTCPAAASAQPFAADLDLIGDPVAGRTKAAVCIGCHGAEGISPSPDFPNLRGQKDVYISKQVKFFRHAVRVDPAMAGISATLSDEDTNDIAAFFYALGSTPLATADGPPQPAVAGDPALGAEKAQLCAACHGRDGISLQRNYPNLRGQKYAYLRKQLGAFRDGPRNDPIMTPMLAAMTDADLDNIAAHFAGLGPTPAPAAD